MRQNPFVNRENQNLVHNMLNALRATGTCTPTDMLFMVAILLYIRKGMDKNPDLQAKNNSPYNYLKPEDPLYPIIKEHLDELSAKVESSVMEELMILSKVSDFNKDEYIYWLDYAINSLNSIKTGIPVMPRSLSVLAEAFLPAKQADIMVPFGGIMNLATDMEYHGTIDATEVNPDSWQLGMIRLALDNQLDKVNFIQKGIQTWTKKQYDTIISFPPLNLKVEMADAHANDEGNKKEFCELVPASRFMESTTNDAVAICYMAPSIQWDEHKKQFRKWAMENKIIDTIILLPQNMLSNTTIPLVCVILKKTPHIQDAIRFIDASGLYTNVDYKNHLEVGDLMNAYHTDQEGISASVSYDVIKEHDYSWNVQEYLLPKEEVPEGYNQKALEDLVTLPCCIKAEKNENGKIIVPSSLSTDWIHPYVDLSTLETKSVLGGTKLTQKAIVVSTIKALNPSIVEASEKKPVWLSKNVLAIIPKDEIDIEYLCMTLSKQKLPSFGTAMPMFSKTTILRQKIAFPNLENQKAIINENRKTLMFAKAKEMGLQELIDQMKTDYINEVRMRKHDMKPYLTQIKSTGNLMKYFIENCETLEELKENINNQLGYMQEATQKLSSLLDHLSDEEKFGKPEAFNIDKYFALLPDEETFDIDYECDEDALKANGLPHHTWLDNIDISNWEKSLKEAPENEFIPLLVNIAPSDLDRMVHNIINNAVVHGFTDPKRHDYNILINLTVDSQRGMFQIDFRNNGNPLPKGMDKERFGIKGEKAGLTGGTGCGGNIIKNIVTHYGGDYDIFQDELSTVVRIWLPIANNEYNS